MDCLNLLLFRERSCVWLPFQWFRIKDVLCLVGNCEVDHFRSDKFVGDFDRELDLLVDCSWHIPNPVGDSSCNLWFELEDECSCRQALFFHVYEHHSAFNWNAHSARKLNLEFVCLLWLDPKIQFRHEFEIITAFVFHRIIDWLWRRVW